MEGSNTEAQRALLRHMLATLAYRAAKALRDAPIGFADFVSGPTARTPCQIVAHMGDLMGWGVRMAQGQPSWLAEGGTDWDTEVGRFFDGVAALDAALASQAAPGVPPRADHPGSDCRRAHPRRSAVSTPGRLRRPRAARELRPRRDRTGSGRARAGPAALRVRRGRERAGVG